MKNSLLERMRKIHSLLQINGTEPVVFDDMCNLLGRLLRVNVMVISKKGEILGLSLSETDESLFAESDMFKGDFVDERFNKLLLSELTTSENMEIEDFPVKDVFNHNVKNMFATIAPMMASGDRIGTVLLYKFGTEFVEEDIILAEYGATVIGLEILREEEKRNANEIRKSTIVKSAIGTLSYSELEAVMHIFNELEGTEGLLVASKIADKVGITRSVIVNALRKFESAGVVECRSLGMKGTYIKVLNDLLIDELAKIKSE
ncbi:MAG: GTP-sensing pleiotropic transcriptional regulator CodY [Clostridia bacterium]|jgi:transcriptional pleiotropic repressor|nr:GTP-sensing pleiotropic transcriptional regulator CodY [Clostridia bacterium]